MNGAGLLALLAALAAGPARAPASAAPDTTSIRLPAAMPGAVLTATVKVPAGVGGRGAARYTIEVGPRVRLFGRPTGTYPAGRVPALIPLTFTLPRDQSAGPLQIAAVTLVWANGVSYTALLVLDVQPVRRLRGTVSAPAAIEAGRSWVLRYAIANLGNATDTVGVRIEVPAGWSAPRPVSGFAVGERDSLNGVVTVRVPVRATPGQYSVTTVAGGCLDTARTTMVVEIQASAAAGGWASVPASFTLLSPVDSLGQGRPRVAFSLQGSLDPATNVRAAFRSAASDVLVPAFYRYVNGPEYFLSLERPLWSLAAGDLYAPVGGLTGIYGYGTGGELAWHGKLLGEVFAARPRELGGSWGSGHLARVSLGVETGIGAVSGRVTDFQRALRPGLRPDQAQSASLVFESGRGGRQQLAIEAGAVRLTTDSALSELGPALDANYSFSSGATFLLARVRQVPAVLPGGTGTNERYLGGGFPLLSHLQAVAWGVSSELPLLGGTSSEHTEASAGLRAHGRYASAQLRGSYGNNHTPGLVTGGDWEQYAVNANAMFTRGLVLLTARGDVGQIIKAGVTRPLRSVEAQASLQGRVASFWLGAGYSLGALGEMPARVDAGGSIRTRWLTLEAGGSAYLPRYEPARFGQLWGAAELGLPLGFSVVAGTDYEPWLAKGQRQRYTVGLRTAFGLPMPVPGRPAARGVVFDDRNGDGQRQEDEEPIPGVGLRLGPRSTSTDALGHFRFPKQPGGRPELSVDMGSLPVGWLLEEFPATRRKVDIPLVRAGALRLLAVSEEAARDSLRVPASGVLVEIVGKDGRRRSATTDSTGLVRFGGLRPGSYQLTLNPVNARGEALAPRTVPVEIEYGSERQLVLPVPTRPLEVRFRTPPPARR